MRRPNIGKLGFRLKLLLALLVFAMIMAVVGAVGIYSMNELEKSSAQAEYLKQMVDRFLI